LQHEELTGGHPMIEISLLLGEGFVLLPVEQTMIWALFYSTLFWLPARGMAAVVDRRRGQVFELDLEEEGARPSYHIGMKILPPI
jgi:hypothetical protein